MIWRRRLFLHIGTHKTGTTSFQHSLAANSAALMQQGIGVKKECLIRPDGRRRHSVMLRGTVNAMVRPELMTGFRVSRLRQGIDPDSEQRETPEEVAADIASRRARSVVASSEGFCFLRTAEEQARVRAFLAATRRKPVILLVHRREADWRASWDNQLRKTPESWQWLQGLPEAQRPDGEWYFDLAAIRAFWRPLGKLREIDYDAEVAARGSILPALYREISADIAALDLGFRRNIRADLDADGEA